MKNDVDRLNECLEAHGCQSFAYTSPVSLS
jgi:hypothetical protein